MTHRIIITDDNGIITWTCHDCDLDVRYDEDASKWMYYNMGEIGINHFNNPEDEYLKIFDDFLQTLE